MSPMVGLGLRGKARARGDSLAVLNLPPGGPIAQALGALGGRIVMRQLELAVEL